MARSHATAPARFNARSPPSLFCAASPSPLRIALTPLANHIYSFEVLLDGLLDELSDLAKASHTCKRWLLDAERRGAAHTSAPSTSAFAIAASASAGAPQRLRVEEKLLYRALLGLGNST